MKAHVGDWLVIEGRTLDDGRRQGEVVELVHADGSPPYRVRWVEDDHESLVFPGPGARIEPHPVPPSVGRWGESAGDQDAVAGGRASAAASTGRA